jgi:glycosyltransferase involved in cell wall biosynthesis
MSASARRYAAITPVRDESENLPRLAAALAAQTIPPSAWVIVDTGSTDSTVELANELAARFDWIVVRKSQPSKTATRGAPIVRAFHHGLEQLDGQFDIVVKLDADISFEPDYFERLLANFSVNDRLGMASGIAYELENGEWVPRFTTGSSVWGAVRAYRRECLKDVLPLEEYMGWDGIDEIKARGRGWTTRTFNDLPFRHHRPEGARDGASWRAWMYRGRAAHYMGYKLWYLGLRVIRHAPRNPAAVAMLWGFANAVIGREPVCPDERVRGQLRREQSILALPRRFRDARGAAK